MGPEVGHFPNVSAICGTLQLNVIISMLGSECQRTGRLGWSDYSRLTAGLRWWEWGWGEAGAGLPLSWEITPGGKRMGPFLGSAGRDMGLHGDMQRAGEVACVFCAWVCMPCSCLSPPGHSLVVIACRCHTSATLGACSRGEAEVCVRLCLCVLHLEGSLSVSPCVQTQKLNSGREGGTRCLPNCARSCVYRGGNRHGLSHGASSVLCTRSSVSPHVAACVRAIVNVSVYV